MNVLLINLRSSEPDLFKNPKVETLGLGYLSSYLRKSGHNVTILDANILDENITPEHPVFKGKRFDVIGFSVLLNNLTASLRLSGEIKKHLPKVHITFGGYYPTFHYKELLQTQKAIDSIIRGEGEVSFGELLTNLSPGLDWRVTPGLAYRGPKGVVANPSPSLVELDTLPFPARETLSELFKKGNRVITLSSSRGCYKDCSFCSIRSFYGLAPGKKYRERSVQNLADEIKALLQREEVLENRVRYFWFCDDEFVGPRNHPRKHAEQIALKLIEEKIDIRYEIDCRADSVNEKLFMLLHRSGLRRVFLGIESFIDAELRFLKKQTTAGSNLETLRILEKVGLDYSVGFILFTPNISLEDFKKNLEHLRRIGYWRVLQPFNRLKIFKGSELSQDNGPLNPSLFEVQSSAQAFNDAEVYDYEFIDQRVASLWEAVSHYSKIHNVGMLTLQRRHQTGELVGVPYWVTKNALFEFTGDIISYLVSLNNDGINLTRQFEFLDGVGMRLISTLANFDPKPLKDALNKPGEISGCFNDDVDDRFRASFVPKMAKNWRAWLAPLVPLPNFNLH